MAGFARQTGQGGNYDHGSAKWKGSLAVAVGDLVWQDSGDSNYTKPAACSTYPGTASAANQVIALQSFKANFAGISLVRRTTGQTTDGNEFTDGPILISGEFDLPIASTTANQPVGALVSVANTGNTLLSSNVAVTSNVSLAIGKVSRPYTTGSGTITVKIYPQVNTGAGIQTIS